MERIEASKRAWEAMGLSELAISAAMYAERSNCTAGSAATQTRRPF
jgi:hypothetical protein